MGVADLSRPDQVEKRLAVGIAGCEAVGEVGVEEFTEELRRLAVGVTTGRPGLPGARRVFHTAR